MKHTTLSTIFLLLALGMSLSSRSQTLKFAVATPADISSYHSSTEDISITPDGNIVTAGLHSDGIWISKHDPSGTSLWSVIVPATPYYFPMDMITDSKGNIYVCGGINHSFDADPSADTATIKSHIDGSGYLLKYDKDGKYLLGFSILNGGNLLNHITLDKDNNCYVSGAVLNFNSKVNLDPSDSTSFVNAVSDNTPFIAKYSEDGKYLWGFAYNGGCNINDIVVDSLNTVLVTGLVQYGKVDIDNGPDSAFIYDSLSSRTFIARYQTNGDYINSMSIGGSGLYTQVVPTSLASDYANNIVMTGYIQGDQIDFDPGSGQYLSNGGFRRRMYVVKYDSQFNFKWLFQLDGGDSATHVSLDTKGNIYLSGRIGSDTIDVDPGASAVLFSANPISSENYAEIFMGMYSPDGEYRWGYLCNSAGADWATCSVPDNNGSIYFAGMIKGDSIDFDPSPAEVLVSSQKNILYPKITDNSPFIAKYSVPTSGVSSNSKSDIHDFRVTNGKDNLLLEFTTYSLDAVSISLYDALGRRILSDEYQPSSVGAQDVRLPFTNQASGLYLCELNMGKIRKTAKLMVIK